MKELNETELLSIEGGNWGLIGAVAALWNNIKQIGTDLGTAAGYGYDALYGPETAAGTPFESVHPD